ncbi:peroxisomal biogenesis factor 11 [Talaromyces proteolyticus]|uniref:Peroxisomal biogenesis factor 11 n=1 Tax=Talaromyces proteolyticus TaxID=1131652 RepID=A0AAD4KR73_9EURO|nr:peroxisomal biogenesis factor 11 [Talaromyces proteolyticus]KAH8695226.1 peroxisomal biogenesis factor 11 [Talaromyces proteolyticus]
MAQLSPASLPKQLANFTNSTAGLDLGLRLLHALTLIGTGVDLDNATVMRCSVAAAQIGLARRYLRFFDFLGCFQNVHDILAAGSPTRTRTAMELAESSALGMYLVLEGTTMLHDMNVYLVSWYTPVLLEAYKFWFYAICIAIARTALDLLFGGESRNSSPSEPILSTASLLNQLVIDALNLIIPGSLLGWIPVSEMGVALAMLVSTILVWPAVWGKAQK